MGLRGLSSTSRAAPILASSGEALRLFVGHRFTSGTTASMHLEGTPLNRDLHAQPALAASSRFGVPLASAVRSQLPRTGRGKFSETQETAGTAVGLQHEISGKSRVMSGLASGPEHENTPCITKPVASIARAMVAGMRCTQELQSCTFVENLKPTVL